LNLTKDFGGKTSEHDLAEKMKEIFKLVKKPHGYSISITNPIVQVATQTLARKVMRKFHVDKVLAPIISLVAWCMKGVQFNWSCYLCSEFLVNCREAQDERKTFHNAWFLLSIVLITWDLQEDS